jgi:serine/threonine protein kinase
MVTQSDLQRIPERYKPVALLGEGGLGLVFEVLDTFFGDMPKALKIIQRELRKDQNVIARFHREYSVGVTLAHPNIIRFFEYTVGDDGNIFFTMEIVRGSDVCSRLVESENKRLSVAAATRIAFEVALALDYAHRNGIVHRDLKPANVMLSPDGTCKLVDFGAARFMEASMRLTPAGDVFGTPLYMSPEVICRNEETPKSDLYSLGALYYEMLTGSPPFTGKTVAAVLAKHTSALPADVREVCPDLPGWCNDIVQTCLDKKPNNRYESAGDLALVLLDSLGQLGPIPSSIAVPSAILAAAAKPPADSWWSRLRGASKLR